MKKITFELPLEKQLELANDQVLKIKNKIEKQLHKEQFPAFKELVEGKYFKYKNNYSCPKKKSDYWYDYTHVTKAVGVDWVCYS